MKKFLSVLLAVLLIWTIALPSYAAQNGTIYYLDADGGNDANNGTSASTAWKTLSAVSGKTFRPGDQILLKAGSIFNGSFTAKGDGTTDQPITFGAYGDIDNLGLPILRSDENVVLIYLHNITGWIVENIELTAPNGKGIYIAADGAGQTSDITVRNCTFHDIWYKQCESYNGGQCPIFLLSSGATARVRNVTLQNCNIYDCAYGINMGGLTREWAPDLYQSPQASYNSDYRIEGMTLQNILYDGVIIGSVTGMVIRDCALINTSLNEDYCTAPMWSHHADNFVIENCEIAGATNTKDGMAVDFDGWTTNATYQYIYSHDNVRFIQNCCYDNYTKNDNCTVRYCLSVNDNKRSNSMAQILSSGSLQYAEDEPAVAMDHFKFYNNTLINCSEIYCHALTNSIIANNIFIGNSVVDSIQFTRKNVDDGKWVVRSFEGEIRNNCFWKMGVPYMAEDNFVCAPCFANTDEKDVNSFKLSAKSPLIGKGIQVEKDMGKYDFYGNELTQSHNIGCYEGNGVDADNTNIFEKVFGYAETILATFIGFIINCNNRFWLF